MNPEQMHMFEAVFNQVAFPITIIKPNAPHFTIIAMNEQRKKASPTPPDQLIGKDTFDAFKSWDKNSEEQLELLRKGFMTVIEEKRQVKLPLLYFELPVKDAPPIRGWAQTEIMPIFDSNGNVEYLLSMGRDVTERELNRLALAEAREKELALSEELAAMNEELESINEELKRSNDDLQSANEELACINEEFAVTNEHLSLSNSLLEQSRQNLQDLNAELEDRILTRTKALADSETRFRTMFETISHMAWTISDKTEATFFNKSWHNYTGLNFENSKGYGWEAILHPDDIDATISKFRDVQAGLKDSGEIENRFKSYDGIYRWHLTRIVPVKNDSGETEMWIATATEINQLKELQQQKDDFISIASHELKTPITSLKGALQLLERLVNEPASPLIPKLIKQSSRSMYKISALVEDLLNLSRISQNRLKLNKSAFNLKSALVAYCNEMRLADQFKVIINGDDNIEVFADEHQIDQVLANFVNNAVKYAPLSKEILVTIAKTDNTAKVTVTDKGPGIAANQLDHVFERYYRVETSDFQSSGLGLGLYISAEIIKQHEGEIGVNSELGKGSSFWFSIPVNS
ncbi:ATP-binding protein [Mucilaginibacter flavus]|uniref:ATP-binding protein n=1 Tax=Mucilaginibacter flavus TaxID=931504 RepID=UPI0025B54364|nr:ATP-binding protein [Mucilaginibacter flavus]MDN3579671.1 ATP-binding protein [Mucilaginibacter flavus]